MLAAPSKSFEFDLITDSPYLTVNDAASITKHTQGKKAIVCPRTQLFGACFAFSRGKRNDYCGMGHHHRGRRRDPVVVLRSMSILTGRFYEIREFAKKL
jgi:hypothetical protein